MDLKGIDWQVVILGKISSRQEDAAHGYAYSLAILRYSEHRSKVSMRNFLLLLSPARLECHLVQLNLSAWNIQLAFSAKEVIVNLKTTGTSPDCCCPSRPPSAIHFWLFLIIYLYVLGLINTNWLPKMQPSAQCYVVLKGNRTYKINLFHWAPAMPPPKTSVPDSICPMEWARSLYSGCLDQSMAAIGSHAYLQTEFIVRCDVCVPYSQASCCLAPSVLPQWLGLCHCLVIFHSCHQ